MVMKILLDMLLAKRGGSGGVSAVDKRHNADSYAYLGSGESHSK